MLLAFRLIQGVGAAFLFVNSVAIVTDAFAGSELGKGIGINQVAINAGTITGYTLSGVLIQLFTWRSIFLVNVPIGIFGTYWSRKRLKEISHPARGEKFDLPGAVTFSAAILLIPLDITLIFIGPISGSLSDKWGARGLSTLGLAIATAGFFYLSGFTTNTPFLQIAIGLVLVGFGIGLFRSPNASSVMGSVSSSKRGIACGVRSTIISTTIVASIPLGLSLMTADVPYDKLVNIIGNVNITGNGQVSGADLQLFLAGLQHALLILSILIIVSAVFSSLRGRRPEPYDHIPSK